VAPGSIYNGMMDHETTGGTKIRSKEWQDQENGILLGTAIFYIFLTFSHEQAVRKKTS